MYRYNKYIVKHLVHSMLLIALSLTSIVWLTQALRFIDFIVNQGVSIGIFVKLTVLLIPSLLIMILPPAMLLSVIFVYNKLRADSELVVMQAAGLSSWRLAMPAIQVAAAVTIFGYVIALWLQPVSYKQFREMQTFLRNHYVSILLQEGVFSNPVDGLTVFIRERDRDNTLRGILVHDSRMPNQAVTMMAETGKLIETPQGPRFLLSGGNRQESSNGRLSFLNFESYALDLSLYTKAIAERIADPQELFLGDLFTYNDALSSADNLKRFAEGHQRLLWPAYALALTLVALAVLFSGQFNRRGQWRRIAAVAALGTLILFSAVGLRGVVTLNPHLIVTAWLNLFVPCLAACWMLGDHMKERRKMTRVSP